MEPIVHASLRQSETECAIRCRVENKTKRYLFLKNQFSPAYNGVNPSLESCVDASDYTTSAACLWLLEPGVAAVFQGYTTFRPPSPLHGDPYHWPSPLWTRVAKGESVEYEILLAVPLMEWENNVKAMAFGDPESVNRLRLRIDTATSKDGGTEQDGAPGVWRYVGDDDERGFLEVPLTLASPVLFYPTDDLDLRYRTIDGEPAVHVKP